MQEKRRYHRLRVEIPITYTVPPRGLTPRETATLDISGTGVAFVTGEELKERQELLMYLLLPEQDKIEVHAKVVRSEVVKDAGRSQYRIGVRIVDPIKFDEKKFIKFYAQKLHEFFGQKERS